MIEFSKNNTELSKIVHYKIVH